MKYSFIAIALFVSLFFGSSSAFSAESDIATIKKLIRELGDENYRTREKATAALEKAGVPALPFLTEALSDPDLEIAIRAKRIRFKVRAADLLKPRLLDYQAKNKKVSQIIRELNALAGENLIASPDLVPEYIAWRGNVGHDVVISIDAKQKSYWEIVHQVCLQSKNEVGQNWIRSRCTVLMKKGSEGVISTPSGPFYVQHVNSWNCWQQNERYCGLSLRILSEKRLPMLHGHVFATVEEATTEKGEKLEEIKDFHFNSSQDAKHVNWISLTLKAPSANKPAKKLDVLKVRLNVTVAGEKKQASGKIADLSEKNFVKVGDLEVKLRERRERGDCIGILVRKPKHSFSVTPQLTIYDAKKKLCKDANTWSVMDDDDCVLYASNIPDSAAVFTVDYYSFTAVNSILIELKDVPLP